MSPRTAVLSAMAALVIAGIACGRALGGTEDASPPPRDAGPEEASAADVASDAPTTTTLFDLTFEDGLVNAANGADEAPGMILAAIPLRGARSAETTDSGSLVLKRIPERDGDVFVAFDARLESGAAGIAEMSAAGEAIFGVALGTDDGKIAAYGGSGGATDGGIVARGQTIRMGLHWVADAGAGPAYRVYLTHDGGFAEPIIEGTLGATARPDGIAIGAIAGDLHIVIDDVRGDTRGFR